MELRGARALVTGGGVRVGRVLAHALLKRGADVALHYHRSAHGAQQTVLEAEAMGRRVELIQADLSDAAAAEALAGRASQALGGLDICINNAAIMERVPLAEVTADVWERTINLNLRGAFFVAKGAAAVMAGAGGAIVNMADLAAFERWTGYPVHVISKAGIVVMTELLAKALAPKIRVNAIAPGAVLVPDDWDDAARAKLKDSTPLGRLGRPEDVAAAMLYLLESDYVTGETIVVDGGETDSVKRYDVIVVGAGPAGMCAALYAGRSMLKTVLIERGAPGGELLNTDLIEDYIGFASIKGHELAQKMADHALAFGAEMVTDNVASVEKRDDGWFTVSTDGGEQYEAPAVILTAGGTPTKLGVPGELEYAGKGVSYCAVCDGHFFRGAVLAVVGGGDAAVEEADFLTRYASKVYIVHRRDQFRASPIIQKRVFENPKIEVVWNKTVQRIEGDATAGVRHLELLDTVTGAASRLAVGGVFVFIGFRPNTGLVRHHFRHDAGGYFVTDGNMMSSIEGLYVAGDVRSQLTRQITTAVGDATTAAIAVSKYVGELKSRMPVGA